MGTLVAIALYAEREQVGEMYKASLRRLSTNAPIGYANVKSWMLKKEVKKMPTVPITAGKWVFMEDDIPTDDEIFCTIIDEIPASKKALETGFLYPLYSRREIGISLYLYGKDYESGYEVRDNGHINVHIALNDVDRPIKELSYDPYYKSLSKEELYENETIRQAARQITQDWDSLFLDVCGVESEEKPYVQHAGMYLEHGWPFPACCSMLYHRDKTEFAKDFLRIYRAHRLERQFMPQMLSKDFDLEKDIDPQSVNIDQAERANYYKHFDFEEHKLIDFLDSLELRKVRKLANFSEAEISAALSLAGEWAAEHAFAYSTKYVDFNEKGGAILSTPTTSIWRVYEYMYHLV